MAILPGSLDYLYHQGILDHIPYEVYPTPIVQNGSQYLNMAQQGAMYNAYNNGNDTFIRRNTTNTKNQYSITANSFGDGTGIGRDVDMEVMANGEEGKSFRQSITDAAEKATDKVYKSSNVTKGILATGIIGLTLYALFRGKKKP